MARTRGDASHVSLNEKPVGGAGAHARRPVHEERTRVVALVANLEGVQRPVALRHAGVVVEEVQVGRTLVGALQRAVIFQREIGVCARHVTDFLSGRR